MSIIRGRSAFSSARKNLVINGDFNIQLRAATTNNCTVDRWISNPGNGTVTASRQAFTIGQTAVPGEPIYYYRHNQTVASNSIAPQSCITHLIEGVRTLAGQTAVLSFWAKAGTTTSPSISLRQHFGTGGSPSGNIDINPTNSLYANLTTNWQKFEFTFSVPSISGKTIGSSGTDHLAIRISAGNFSATTFDIARVQLEVGSTSTDFEIRDTGRELELCQRYYQIGRCDFYGVITNGYVQRAVSHLATPMRANPTVTNVNLSNAAFPAVTGLSVAVQLGYIGGVNVIVVDDRQANATGNGTFASEVRCDAELVEA